MGDMKDKEIGRQLHVCTPKAVWERRCWSQALFFSGGFSTSGDTGYSPPVEGRHRVVLSVQEGTVVMNSQPLVQV